MTVRELIDELDELQQDYPVVIGGTEITEVTTILLRDELFLTADQGYAEGFVIKLS